MRTDEKARLKEQKLQLLTEMRALAASSQNPENTPRWHELKAEVEEINRIADAEHERELREIREGRSLATTREDHVQASVMERASPASPCTTRSAAEGSHVANGPRCRGRSSGRSPGRARSTTSTRPAWTS